MKLFIKNMVSLRCKLVVKAELEKLNLHTNTIELGEANIKEEKLTVKQYNALKASLHAVGLELMNDRKEIFIEKIKDTIIEMVHYENEIPQVKYSNYLSQKLNCDYTYLSNVFSQAKGTTIRHFIIAHKIERVKELIVYSGMTISEIAWKLNYSSKAHLSSQFKKITGFTPSHFKIMQHKNLTPLENL